MAFRRLGAITALLTMISAGCLLLDNRCALAAKPAAELVSFDRQVRLILAAKCFPCHGPDAATRQADLRLDDPAVLPALQASGLIVPGQPEQSELIGRVRSSDAALRMPPSNGVQQLTAAEIELLAQWVEQGAKYEPHWSFTAPQSPPIPDVLDTPWPETRIGPGKRVRDPEKGQGA